jgi:hypothetical protein
LTVKVFWIIAHFSIANNGVQTTEFTRHSKICSYLLSIYGSNESIDFEISKKKKSILAVCRLSDTDNVVWGITSFLLT